MHRLFACIAFLACFPALAQSPKAIIFGEGRRPTFREEAIDRKFQRSRLARALSEGTTDENCKALLGGLLTALAETAPFFHNRDENLHFDPSFLAAFQAQLNTPSFPANAYLVSMARHVLIQRRMPDAWLKTAESINTSYGIIDLAKLKLISEGINPIDSFLLTLPLLRQRFDEDVLAVTSASRVDVATEFKDTYLDREVTFPGMQLVDIGLYSAKTKKKLKTPPKTSLSQLNELVAVFTWVIPGQKPSIASVLGTEKAKIKTITVYAYLAPRQYVNLDRIPKGARLMIRGRLWSMNADLTEVEIKNALLFEDRDWSRAFFAQPGMVDNCPFAVNDLTGVAPAQPGGFNRVR